MNSKLFNEFANVRFSDKELSEFLDFAESTLQDAIDLNEIGDSRGSYVNLGAAAVWLSREELIANGVFSQGLTFKWLLYYLGKQLPGSKILGFWNRYCDRGQLSVLIKQLEVVLNARRKVLASRNS